MATEQSARIYYLASGNLGVPVLDVLADDPAITLLGVGTQPDRPAGRRRIPAPTPVGRRSLERGLVPDRIPSVNKNGFADRLQDMNPDLVVVVAFGQILREPILSLAPGGCLNVHASLLPRHRGAAPINAAILAGDTRTGITFMKMDRGLDTGPVYGNVPIDINPCENAEELEQRLARLAARHIVCCIGDIVSGTAAPKAQPEEGATYAPKLKKDDGRIDWTRPATAIERAVRGLFPWPGAYTDFPGHKGPVRLRVTAARVLDEDPGATDASPGVLIREDRDGPVIACGDRALQLLRVVPEGRREMDGAAFLRGCPPAEPAILGG